MTEHLIGLCTVCGGHYDMDFEPPLGCHEGLDDWEIITYREDDDLVEDLLDLTDEWHDGKYGYEVSLEDLIRARTGWNSEDFGLWAIRGIHADLGGFRVD